jgi:hypothetical protein
VVGHLRPRQLAQVLGVQHQQEALGRRPAQHNTERTLMIRCVRSCAVVCGRVLT